MCEGADFFFSEKFSMYLPYTNGRMKMKLAASASGIATGLV
jgi:hypothetical protein